MLEDDGIILRLNKNEALVLFEFLARFNEIERIGIFEDQAEEKVLWILEGQLEKILAEPFLPNYLEIVYEARNQIRDEDINISS